MDRPKRILIVDNLEEWRERLVEILQKNGYYASSTSTISEALKQLDENIYHVVVTDIRMEETDQNNNEGITLLKELEELDLSEATKVIMLSAYGTPEYMRLAFKDYKVADFLSKDTFSDENFLQSIKHVFYKDVKIKLTLEISWPRSKKEQAVLDLKIGEKRVKRNSHLFLQLTEELEDLLCRLFYQADSITVKPLPSGHSGTGVLRVEPYYDDKGFGREVIVKYGEFSKIQQEYNNFKKFVEPFISTEHNTTLLNNRRTPHLGSIIYSLLDTSNGQLMDFGDFYERSEASTIKAALDQLFLKTCIAWYNTSRPPKPLDLKEMYKQLFNYTPRRLEQLLSQRLTYTQGKQGFHIPAYSTRTFTSPWQIIAELLLNRNTVLCINHGDFNQHNLLVNAIGNTWRLIDFQETGWSHILRDFAMLDSVIRFQLLKSNEATMEERLQLEEALCKIERFSQLEQLEATVSMDNSALAKAYTVVIHLRRLAYDLLKQNRGNDDISEYYIALLFTALNTLQFFSLSQEQLEHALISASLLADRIVLMN